MENHNTPTPGRPPVGPVVAVRVPETIKEIIDGEAHKAGVSRAAWIRQLLTEALAERPA